MAAPVYTDLVIYPGANGTPANNTDPIGGAITTAGGPIDGTVLNADLYTIQASIYDTPYYTVLYFQNNCTSPGTLTAARIYNRAGARVNSSAGVCQYVSTSNADIGQILTTGKVSGVYQQETVTLTGTTPATGAQTWDSGTIIRHESLSSSGTPQKPVGNITVSCSSQIIAVVYGTASNPSGQDLSVYTCSAEFQFALATAKGYALTNGGRLAVPNTGVSISSFAYATYWAGEDNSLAVPGAALAYGEYIGMAIQYTSYVGAPLPISNVIYHFPIILGTPN